MPDATISADGKYRYSLEREWIGGTGRVLWVMLNPSTADAVNNDSTMRRCIDFSQQWGFAGLYVGNLYAYRSRDPRDLVKVDDPIGPLTDEYLALMARKASAVVCAWGQRGPRVSRWEEVVTLLLGAATELFVLGFTKYGNPRHPLRLRKDLKLQRWLP